MSGYVIADVEVLDADGYTEYRERVGATLAQYGGRFLVRGGTAQTMEGDHQPQRLVIIEFPSVERATQWYASSAYSAIVPIRQRYGHTHHLTIVAGV